MGTKMSKIKKYQLDSLEPNSFQKLCKTFNMTLEEIILLPQCHVRNGNMQFEYLSAEGFLFVVLTPDDKMRILKSLSGYVSDNSYEDFDINKFACEVVEFNGYVNNAIKKGENK